MANFICFAEGTLLPSVFDRFFALLAIRYLFFSSLRREAEAISTNDRLLRRSSSQ
jgi:hypothetical protein